MENAVISQENYSYILFTKILAFTLKNWVMIMKTNLLSFLVRYIYLLSQLNC